MDDVRVSTMEAMIGMRIEEGELEEYIAIGMPSNKYGHGMWSMDSSNNIHPRIC